MPWLLKNHTVACIENQQCSAELKGDSNENEQGGGYALMQRVVSNESQKKLCDMSDI